MKIAKHSLKRAATAAFTLVEMVIVIAIIGILATAVIVNVGGATDDAKYRVAQMGIDQLKQALASYEGNNNSRPPTAEQGLMALVERPTSEPIPQRWRVYVDDVDRLEDPWGNPYQYQIPPERSRGKAYDIFSFGPDGVKSDEDDIGNWKAKTTTTE